MLMVDNYHQCILTTKTEPQIDHRKDTKLIIEDHTQMCEAMRDNVLETAITIMIAIVREVETKITNDKTFLTEVTNKLSTVTKI